MSELRRPRIAVIGGGISGLAAAHRIQELDSSADLVLLEAGSELGGVLRTERRDGYLIEHGADNFITTMPWTLDFCQRIGFEQELVSTNDTHRRAFVVLPGIAIASNSLHGVGIPHCIHTAEVAAEQLLAQCTSPNRPFPTLC